MNLGILLKIQEKHLDDPQIRIIRIHYRWLQSTINVTVCFLRNGAWEINNVMSAELDDDGDDWCFTATFVHIVG